MTCLLFNDQVYLVSGSEVASHPEWREVRGPISLLAVLIRARAPNGARTLLKLKELLLFFFLTEINRLFGGFIILENS